MSDQKEGASKRRDVRNVKDAEEVPKVDGAKKKTRKWCKGKVGVEHTLVCRNYVDVKYGGSYVIGDNVTSLYQDWKLLMCSTCGKELEFWYPLFRNDPNVHPPAWVTGVVKPEGEKP